MSIYVLSGDIPNIEILKCYFFALLHFTNISNEHVDKVSL